MSSAGSPKNHRVRDENRFQLVNLIFTTFYTFAEPFENGFCGKI
jgi:hypothetical protein